MGMERQLEGLFLGHQLSGWCNRLSRPHRKHGRKTRHAKEAKPRQREGQALTTASEHLKPGLWKIGGSPPNPAPGFHNDIS